MTNLPAPHSTGRRLPYIEFCLFTGGIPCVSSSPLALSLRVAIGLAFAAAEFLQISRVWV